MLFTVPGHSNVSSITCSTDPAGAQQVEKFSRELLFVGRAWAARLSIHIWWCFSWKKHICLFLRHHCCFTGLEVTFTTESASFSGESRLPAVRNLKDYLWLLNYCSSEQNPTSVSQENPATSCSFTLGVAQGERTQKEEAAGFYVWTLRF